MKNLSQTIITSSKGVFTTRDLQNIFQANNAATLNNKIISLTKRNIIRPYIKGIYIVPNEFDPYILSQTLCEQSYISLETVLAKSLIIGTQMTKKISAIKIGKDRQYTKNTPYIFHYSINKNLFFGFEIKNGIKIASPEKALLDIFYFYLRGHKFSFDIYSDLNLSKINFKQIKQMLKKYKNRKFIAFVKNILESYGYHF